MTDALDIYSIVNFDLYIYTLQFEVLQYTCRLKVVLDPNKSIEMGIFEFFWPHHPS